MRRAAWRVRSAGSVAATSSPFPASASLAELNELVAAGDVADDRRRIDGRAITVGEHFALEALTLAAAAGRAVRHDAAAARRGSTPSRGCVSASASTRCRSATSAGASRSASAPRPIEVLDGAPRRGASMPGSSAKGGESLVLDHYLEVLRLKPGALPGATALARARASGAFSADHERFWTAGPTPARRPGRHPRPDRGAARPPQPARRRDPRRHCAACVDIGVVDPDVVIVEARRAAGDHTAAVVPIGDGLARYDRPLPTIAHYDQLLEAR